MRPKRSIYVVFLDGHTFEALGVGGYVIDAVCPDVTSPQDAHYAQLNVLLDTARDAGDLRGIIDGGHA